MHWDATSCSECTWLYDISFTCLTEIIQHVIDHDLETIIDRFIIPALSAQDVVLRREGLRSLGLCCLLSKVRAFPLYSDPFSLPVVGPSQELLWPFPRSDM